MTLFILMPIKNLLHKIMSCSFEVYGVVCGHTMFSKHKTKEQNVSDHDVHDVTSISTYCVTTHILPKHLVHCYFSVIYNCSIY